jgi:flagellar protein FliO/FliZ
MRRITLTALLAAGLAVSSLLAPAALAGPSAGQPVPGALETGSIVGPALRMVVSLGAVLALVAGLAWLAQKLRAGGRFKSGLIEVVSGVSLGAREKVVLLRVGQEQVLVGVSPAGMSALHVIRDPAATPPFSSYIGKEP